MENENSRVLSPCRKRRNNEPQETHLTRTVVLGTGSHLPEGVLTNRDLEAMVDTSDEWITSRSGIKERRISSKDETCSFLSTKAAEKALQMAEIAPAEVDMIIVCTLTPDMLMPTAACLVQKNLGAAKAVAFDLSAACSGFLYGLAVADSFVKNRKDMKILVIGAEVLSCRVNWKDRNTCVLFGDGAGAVVVTGSNGKRGILSNHLHADGSLWKLLHIPGGGCLTQPSRHMVDNGMQYIHMQGKDVFRLAIKAMEESTREALEFNKLSADDIDLYIPHQANIRIINGIAERLKIPMEKVFVNIQRYGNTSAATIPIALDEANREGRIKKGDLVLLSAFGGGFTWGASVIRW